MEKLEEIWKKMERKQHPRFPDKQYKKANKANKPGQPTTPTNPRRPLPIPARSLSVPPFREISLEDHIGAVEDQLSAMASGSGWQGDDAANEREEERAAAFRRLEGDGAPSFSSSSGSSDPFQYLGLLEQRPLALAMPIPPIDAPLPSSSATSTTTGMAPRTDSRSPSPTPLRNRPRQARPVRQQRSQPMAASDLSNSPAVLASSSRGPPANPEPSLPHRGPPVFETLGRDEMEIKTGNLRGFEHVDGIFGKAKDMQQLKEARKRISGSKKKEDKGDKKEHDVKGCGCACGIM
jgi:hypothetical protein